MTITILGSGCPNCKKLEAMCHEATAKLGINAQIEKVTETNLFGNYGVWLTPGLIINDELKVQGKLPTTATLEGWIRNAEKNNSKNNSV